MFAMKQTQMSNVKNVRFSQGDCWGTAFLSVTSTCEHPKGCRVHMTGKCYFPQSTQRGFPREVFAGQVEHAALQVFRFYMFKAYVWHHKSPDYPSFVKIRDTSILRYSVYIPYIWYDILLLALGISHDMIWLMRSQALGNMRNMYECGSCCLISDVNSQMIIAF